MSIRKMIGRHPQVQGSVNEALALAVRHMMFCSDICTSCADACIAEDKVADLRQCIRVCLDCADVCDMAFKVGTRRTGSNEMLLRSTLELCIQACEICAQECGRSEEHTSELQSLMRISYAVFCLKQKNTRHNHSR